MQCRERVVLEVRGSPEIRNRDIGTLTRTLPRKLRFFRALLACGLVAGLPACGARWPGDLPTALQDENPSIRAEACRRAGEAKDASVVPLLVERLDDPAGDVRFFAIGALERITGQTLGYRYHDEPETRSQAVWRWRDWLRAGPAPAKDL